MMNSHTAKRSQPRTPTFLPAQASKRKAATGPQPGTFVAQLVAPEPQPSASKLTTDFGNKLLAELPRLRAYSRSLARNPDRADDLVQETLAKAWAHQRRFKDGTNLRAWLFTILRNTYYGELRARRREVSDSDGHHSSQLATAPAQLDRLEFLSVARAFDDLSDTQREALFLVGVSGLPYEKAAKIADCAVGTIKSRVCRARKLLQEILGDGERVISESAAA